MYREYSRRDYCLAGKVEVAVDKEDRKTNDQFNEELFKRILEIKEK